LSNHLLNSWKEIANYLGRGVRTVQRWEAQLGLPVHRPAGHSRSAVIAFEDELTNWLRATSQRERDAVERAATVLAWPQPTSANGDGTVFAFDWSNTPLGPADTWSQTLRAAVGTELARRNTPPSVANGQLKSYERQL
jgi:hypothetical protein